MYVVNASLLDAPMDFAIAQCISSDCAMGITSSGKEVPCLALTLRKKYPMMARFCKTYDTSVNSVIVYRGYDDRLIFNLVTKTVYYGKPNYKTMLNVLFELRRKAILAKVAKLAIPKLGSGLDGLLWDQVSEMVGRVFLDSGIEVVLYNPSGKEIV